MRFFLLIPVIIPKSYNNQIEMSFGAQFVISLNRLSLPSENTWKRVTLSVETLLIEYFIQNEKIVKGCKVNFYRQNLFIHDNCTRLAFNLYGIATDGTKTLLKTFTPPQKQLQSIQKRPTMFRIEEEGYELIWDSWIFTQESSYMNQESQKDYSELDLPFENKHLLSEILMNSQSQNFRLSSLVHFDRTTMKRHSSTCKKASNGQKGSQVTSVQKRKKSHIKSQIYTKLVARITDILSPTKA